MTRPPLFQERKVEVTLASDKLKAPMTLGYRVLNHSVATRWLSLIDSANSKGFTLHNNYRRARSLKEYEGIIRKLYELVANINSRYDHTLYVPPNSAALTNDQLNDLHEQFEIYGGRLATNIPLASDQELHQWMLRLNETIHTLQSFQRTGEPLRLCTTDFLPAGEHLPLEPEDYMLFTTDLRWGWIYLGYNTLGKNIMAAAQDNDLDIIVEGRAVAQRRFAVEFQMYWMDKVDPYARRTLLHKWWAENQLSQTRSPDMRLSELAAGYIPLAQFTTLNGSPIPQRPDTQMFNQWIWDRYDRVVSVRTS